MWRKMGQELGIQKRFRGKRRLLGEQTESEGRMKAGDDCVHGLGFK